MKSTGRKIPLKPRIRRAIAIPSSLFIDDKEPIKTYKVGFLARIAAIFRIEEISVFLDGEERNAYFIKDVLNYVNVPQYLRKRTIPLKRTLRYVGVLPPLRTPHHPDAYGKGFVCEYREGIVLKRKGDTLLIDAGLEAPIAVKGDKAVGSKVIIKLSGGEARITDESKIPYYWGFKVSIVKSLNSLARKYERYLRIATSFYGEPIDELKDSIARKSVGKKGVLVAFGSRKGLFEIARNEGVDLFSLFDLVINFIPSQGTYTIRTEEALPISLSILNLIMD